MAFYVKFFKNLQEILENPKMKHGVLVLMMVIILLFASCTSGSKSAQVGESPQVISTSGSTTGGEGLKVLNTAVPTGIDASASTPAVTPLVDPQAMTGATVSVSDDYEKVTRDLHALNLVNVLFLSREQMKKLLPLVEQADRSERELQAIKAKNYAPFMQVMRDIREHLMTNTGITEELQERLDKYSIPVYEKMAKNKDEIQKLVGEVKKILNENQLQIIANYEPCIAPNASAADPERIGGVGGGEAFVELLEKMRGMPEKEYQKEKKRILDHKRMMMKAYNTPEQIESVLRQMENSMDRARKMSDVDFQLHGGELGDIVMPKSGRPKGVNMTDEFIARFLLDPIMIDYIKRKMGEER